eukprot:5290567-Heterocapsa_arctica.AAC.1
MQGDDMLPISQERTDTGSMHPETPHGPAHHHNPHQPPSQHSQPPPQHKQEIYEGPQPRAGRRQNLAARAANPEFGHRQEQRHPPGRQQRPPTPTLPADFLKNLRNLKGTTTIHVPHRIRERFASCISDCLEGAMEGDQ